MRFVRLVYVDIRRCEFVCILGAFGLKRSLSMLKTLLEAQHVSDVYLIRFEKIIRALQMR